MTWTWRTAGATRLRAPLYLTLRPRITLSLAQGLLLTRLASPRLHILGHRLIKGSTISEHLKQGTSTRVCQELLAP